MSWKDTGKEDNPQEKEEKVMGFNDPKVFEVTQDHLKLLDRTFIGYDDWVEFGAPGVDPKRPYGNSDVYGDIAEIIGLPGEGEDGEFSDPQRDFMLRLHKEMQHVLQILVRNRGIEVGTYKTSGSYNVDWRKV